MVKLGDSDSMHVGDWVVAIGNPFGLASSVSAGIISARARNIGAGPYDDFLQTDAAINPGNSGGPLFNLNGEVIGINTAIVGGGSGIGFAVPSNMAKELLPQLANGKIQRGWLGVSVQDLNPELAKALKVPQPHGALIGDVPDNEGPAKKAGIQPEDVVVAIDGSPIDSARALTRSVGFKKPGSTVTLTLYRDGKKQDVKLQLGERPDREGVSSSGDQQNGQDEARAEKLGLAFDDVPNQLQGRGGNASGGAVVTNVDPGSPADRAELRQGMIIVEANGKPVKRARDLAQVLREAKSGSTVLMRIQVEGGRILRAMAIP